MHRQGGAAASAQATQLTGNGGVPENSKSRDSLTNWEANVASRLRLESEVRLGASN